jgi:hypothetical protein
MSRSADSIAPAPAPSVLSLEPTRLLPPASDPTAEATLEPSTASPVPTDSLPPPAVLPTEKPSPTDAPQPLTPPPTERPLSDTCLEGFAWRMAGPDDKVCVTSDARAQAQQDNAVATSRLAAADAAYGPDTCKQGYVWREAFPDDHVCLTGDVRSQTQRDNGLAASRTVP